MKMFREKQIPLLVATDVAARGLDVNNLTHVINYNLPEDLSTYTHRSGRTGRAGKKGTSVAIIHMREHYKVNQLERQLGQTFTQKLVPTGEEIATSRLFDLIDKIKKMKIGEGLIDKNLEKMSEQLADLSKEELIKRFENLDLGKMLLFYRDSYDLSKRQHNPRTRAKKLNEKIETRRSRKPRSPKNDTRNG